MIVSLARVHRRFETHPSIDKKVTLAALFFLHLLSNSVLFFGRNRSLFFEAPDSDFVHHSIAETKINQPAQFLTTKSDQPFSDIFPVFSLIDVLAISCLTDVVRDSQAGEKRQKRKISPKLKWRNVEGVLIVDKGAPKFNVQFVAIFFKVPPSGLSVQCQLLNRAYLIREAIFKLKKLEPFCQHFLSQQLNFVSFNNQPRFQKAQLQQSP